MTGDWGLGTEDWGLKTGGLENRKLKVESRNHRDKG